MNKKKLRNKYKNAGLSNKIECPSTFVKTKNKKQIVKRKKISDLKKGEMKKCENILANDFIPFQQKYVFEMYLKSLKNGISK